jgi:hypothetical protein
MEGDKGIQARFGRFTQSFWGLGGNPPRERHGPE